MELNKYDKLRRKISSKNFEGKFKGLNLWLYRLSILGNLGSVFFAYFLVTPALKRAITTNLIDGNFAMILAILATILILVSFELIKRLLLKSLSFDLVKNKFNITKGSVVSWFIFSIIIVGLSMFLSINGAKKFATTSIFKNDIVKDKMIIKTDSIRENYTKMKSVYVSENNNLRNINGDLRTKQTETPLDYMTVRDKYQNYIDKNTKVINNNESKISKIDSLCDVAIFENNKQSLHKQKENKDNDFTSILLFIIISTAIEFIIVLGVYFREYYEYSLYLINKDKLEPLYKKRDRYRVMLEYIYHGGNISAGERLMAGERLIELVEENSTISDPKNFIRIFLRDMEEMNIFVVEGKRRLLKLSYEEAIDIINNFEDSSVLLKNLK
jgi:hypothetical protein